MASIVLSAFCAGLYFAQGQYVTAWWAVIAGIWCGSSWIAHEQRGRVKP